MQDQQRLQLRASVGYALELVLMLERCKQIGLGLDLDSGLGSRLHGSGSRLFSYWYGSRWHPPRHHGLGQQLLLTPKQHWQ